jgi:integrase
MALVNLNRLHAVTSKGRTYYYAWRGGPRIEAAFGTKEFFEEVLSARNPTSALDRRKMATWVALFKGSPEYADFGKHTKANWGPKLDDVARHFGTLSVSAFDKPQIRGHIKAWRDKWRETPRTADMAKQALSRLCSFIISEGALATNPCEGIANIYSANRADIIWTKDHMDAFAKVNPDEMIWAMELAALTGLRQSALLAAPWTKATKFCLDMTEPRSKAKGRGLVPIYPALRDLLDRIPKRAMTILTTQDGEPWKTGFGSSWTKAMARAKLDTEDLHFHDLRGTAATNFYRAGLTSQEIAQTLGWELARVEEMLDRYVKRDELMIDRIKKMERNASSTGGKKEQG